VFVVRGKTRRNAAREAGSEVVRADWGALQTAERGRVAVAGLGVCVVGQRRSAAEDGDLVR
jgi:hypothetical protein